MVIKGRETPDKNINNDDDQEAIIKVTQQETVIQKDTIWENIDKMHPYESSNRENNSKSLDSTQIVLRT